MLFEAVPDGVMRRSVVGTFAPQREWIAVLRPKRPLPPNGQGLTVAHYAEARYGRAYSYRGALASRLPIVGGAVDGSVFCSQVIAQAFHDYGLDLVPGKLPAQVYPGMLFHSPELTDVTEDCIRKLGSVTDTDAYTQVIGTAAHELPGTEMQMNREVFEALQKELGKDLPARVYSLTDLGAWLAQEYTTEAAQRSDAKILGILETEGMFSWYDAFSEKVRRDAAVLEFVADAAEKISGGPWPTEMEAFLAEVTAMSEHGESRVDARRNTAQDYNTLAEKTGFKTFARLRDEYQRQYEDACRIHDAQARLLKALRQRKAEESA